LKDEKFKFKMQHTIFVGADMKMEKLSFAEMKKRSRQAPNKNDGSKETEGTKGIRHLSYSIIKYVL